jgi:hypothetical protein
MLFLGTGVHPSLAVSSPTLSTIASPSTEVGLQIFDNANLQGGQSPTGTITFTLFGPGDTTCTTPLSSSDVPVSGNGSYNSARVTTTQAGTYRWQARYSGDANNTAAGPTACADPAEAVIVDKARAALTTTASGPVNVGVPIHDTAVLAGGFNPTGSITFLAYAPTDLFCSGTPVFSSTVPVNGNGTYVSASFPPNGPGAYKWRASYTGDANNLSLTLTACIDPNEASTVLVGSGPTLTTVASAATVVGGQVSDTATLLGGNDPTGTITFRLYGPDDATCTGPVASTSAKTVAGNGVVASDPATVTLPGTYRFVATYSGDANNPTIATACTDPTESVLVAGGPVPTTTVVPVTTTVPSTTTTPVPTTSPGTSSTAVPTTIPVSTVPPTTAPPTTVPPTTVPATTVPPTTVPPTTVPPTTVPGPTSTSAVPTTSTTVAGPTSTSAVPTTSTTVPVATTSIPGTTLPATTSSTTPATTTTVVVPTGTTLGTTTTVVGQGAPALAVSPSSVPAGQNLTVTGTRFPTGPVEVTLFSTPALLALVTVGPTGSFTVVVTIPGDTPPGVHRVVATGANGAVLAETSVNVTAAGLLQVAAQVVNTLTRQLSRTGTDVTGAAGVAVAMVVLGLLMVGTSTKGSLAGAGSMPPGAGVGPRRSSAPPVARRAWPRPGGSGDDRGARATKRVAASPRPPGPRVPRRARRVAALVLVVLTAAGLSRRRRRHYPWD